MAKSINSMTKAELKAVIIKQGKRLDKAKFYYRQQKTKIDELVAINDNAVKLLRKSYIVKNRKK
jgi:hypothetical protein